ncbi:MAG: preprotein translocase subunit SecG [Treponema sp.]|nr:preprotein translocase subunit SecG [Treponema sp.]
MGVLSVVLLVFFVIIAVLLVLLVLIQNDEGGGFGGMFGGGANTAFGSRSGNVLTRATTVLGSLFLIISLSLAILSRTPTGSGVEEEARRLATQETSSGRWLQDELYPPPPSPAPENVPYQDITFDQLFDDDFYSEHFGNND